MIGTVLNQRYSLLGKVGEGGMAEVYRAQDTLLERVVAAKVLRSQYASDPEFLARFLQEARAAARLSHPGIVPVYDVGTDNGLNYIVMELIEGVSLKQVIADRGALSIAKAVDYAIQMLGALSYAHQHGVIHRDVKPQNILITPEGQVRVADFGIARAANTPQLTTAGMVVGTAQYCSPEQAMGKPTTAASDIYAVGVVLYEMLSGVLPFDGDNPVAVALRHVQELAVPPSQRNPLIPKRLESVVMQALAKEPERRFQTAATMRDALRTYQQAGNETTSVFAPVRPTATASRPGAQALAAGAYPRRGSGVDWLAVVLGLLVFVLVAGAIPLALRIYNAYYGVAPEATAKPGTVLVQTAPTHTQIPGLLTSPTATSQVAGAETQQPRPSTSVTTGTPVGTPVPSIEVPELIGKPYEQIRQQLVGIGLNVTVTDEAYSTQYDVGIVTAQSPDPHAVVGFGSMIEVAVSKGTEKVLVIPVVGLTVEEATSKLKAEDFQVNVTEDWNDTVPAGSVAEQDPLADSVAAKGSAVSLVSSKGPQPVTPTPSPTASSVVRPPEGDWAWVPHLVGLPEAEARRRIDEAGLSNTYTNYQDENVVSDKSFFRSIAPGSVLSATLNPNIGTPANPGERIQRGTTIYLAVRRR